LLERAAAVRYPVLTRANFYPPVQILHRFYPYRHQEQINIPQYQRDTINCPFGTLLPLFVAPIDFKTKQPSPGGTDEDH
jgi:hypothetical protein